MMMKKLTKINTITIAVLLLLGCSNIANDSTIRPVPPEPQVDIVDEPANSPNKRITCIHKYEETLRFTYEIKDAIAERVEDSDILQYTFIDINTNIKHFKNSLEMENYYCNKVKE